VIRRASPRLWQGVPNGAQPECVSDYGSRGPPGEHGRRRSRARRSARTGRASSTASTPAGPGTKARVNQCRPKILHARRGLLLLLSELRCCAAPDGAPERSPYAETDQGQDRVQDGGRLREIFHGPDRRSSKRRKRGECTVSRRTFSARRCAARSSGRAAKGRRAPSGTGPRGDGRQRRRSPVPAR